MTAFSFKPYMAPKILDGTKLSTIRSTKRCEVGDTMQLYTGMRTKKCKKLKDVVCIGVAPIMIREPDIWAIIGKIEGNIHPANVLHLQEGFKNAQEFLEFFRQEYGLPYRGWIHAWLPE